VIVPKRPSLIAGAAESLKKAIESGEMSGVLPNVPTLSNNLCVSVPTVVAAVRILARDGYVVVRQGCATKVIFAGQKVKRAPVSSPRKIVMLSLGREILLDCAYYRDLADHLRKLEFEVEMKQFSVKTWQQHEERFAYAVTKMEVACWVLIDATSRVQKWFSDRKLPCLVSGRLADQSVHLPDFEIDFISQYRHCANQLLNLGHERIHLLITEGSAAKNPQSIDAFVDTIRRRFPDAAAKNVVQTHDGSPENCEIVLERLFSRSHKPTALFVVWVNFYVLSQSWLHTRGYRIPEDVSLVSRDSDETTLYLRPRPAHYICSSRSSITRRLVRAIMTVIDKAHTEEHSLVLPELVRGDSLAPPRD
jgi:DNA-binding LacI/PurR family transcriptional regulator